MLVDSISTVYPAVAPPQFAAFVGFSRFIAFCGADLSCWLCAKCLSTLADIQIAGTGRVNRNYEIIGEIPPFLFMRRFGGGVDGELRRGAAVRLQRGRVLLRGVAAHHFPSGTYSILPHFFCCHCLKLL